MKNLIVSLIVASASLCACVQAANTPATAESRRKTWMQYTGGYLLKPDSAKGQIVFVNAQTNDVKNDFARLTTELSKDLRYNYKVVDAPADLDITDMGKLVAAKNQFNADVLIVLIDDKKSPTLCAVPEDSCAVVNLNGLSVGLNSASAKEKFLHPRLRKELMRAFAYACGAGGSTYKVNILTIGKITELDYCDEFVPHDALESIAKTLQKKGVTFSIRSTYRIACEQGWAPAPTNDIQKAIWDKVHQLPTKPIKILPETKPVKE